MADHGSRASVEALAAAYLAAYSGRDADGCAATFTVDAVMHSPFGPSAVGRDAIAAAHREWFGEDERDKRMEITELEAMGARAHCTIAWSALLSDASAPGGERRAGGVTLAVLDLTGPGPLFHRMALVPDPE